MNKFYEFSEIPCSHLRRAFYVLGHSVSECEPCLKALKDSTRTSLFEERIKHGYRNVLVDHGRATARM